MRVRHIYPSASCRAEVAPPLAFHVGTSVNWCSLSSTRQSRYEGWFIDDPRSTPISFTKILDRIIYKKGDDGVELPPDTLTLTEKHAWWEYSDGMRLGFAPLQQVRGLRIQASRLGNFELLLDIRNIYQTPDLGREYTIRQVGRTTFVRYTDPLIGKMIHLAIQTDGEVMIEERWDEVQYPWDAGRNSTPTSGYVLSLGALRGTWIALGAGDTADAAQAAALSAAVHQIPVVGIGIAHETDSILQQIAAAKVAARNTLDALTHPSGVFAGLPWFHQVWSRDELIAALGMEPHEQLQIIERYLETPVMNGELPTFIGSGTTCADGVGWLALLIREYGLTNLPADLRATATRFFTDATNQLRSHLSPEGLVPSGHNATWMDTIGRIGCRIEIQCMTALALQLLGELTGEPHWESERKSFLETIRQHFLHGASLWDGAHDSSVRPNVFIAYLLQPDLLTAAQWEAVFGTALTYLRTTWGGLSSLDRRHPDFLDHSTGQDNRSYHQGDSWFFVNNLAGLALYRFGMRQFKPVIEELIRSSTEEILWKHVAGHAGEIASASDGASWGCGVQAFAAGPYLLFAREITR